MQLSLNLPTPLAAREALFLDHDQPFTTSRAVAARFGKKHFHVLRAIEQLLSDIPDPAFTESNFGFSEYIDPTGRALPEYRLTHDGFALLAMGFTGTQALAWKVAFIQAFNALEAELRARVEREAAALYRLRPRWQPITAHPELSRSQLICLTGHQSVASITACRRAMRQNGLLPQRAA